MCFPNTSAVEKIKAAFEKAGSKLKDVFRRHVHLSKQEAEGEGTSTEGIELTDNNTVKNAIPRRSKSKRLSIFAAIQLRPQGKMQPRDDSNAAKNAARVQPDVNVDPEMVTLADLMAQNPEDVKRQIQEDEDRVKAEQLATKTEAAEVSLSDVIAQGPSKPADVKVKDFAN